MAVCFLNVHKAATLCLCLLTACVFELSLDYKFKMLSPESEIEHTSQVMWED